MMQPEMFDASTDLESMKLGPSLARAMRLSAERIDRVIKEVQPTHIVATVSGGRDSAAEVELARELGVKIDLILHCRTGTGIRQTTEHVVDHYGNLGPDFVMADAGDAYEEYVMRKGFFGIGRTAHNFSYRVLKATPMRKAISRAIRHGKRGVRVLLLNGARASESENRQINLPETRRDKACPGNIWVNIIHDWTAGDRDQYLRLRGTPINPVAIQLCRSGECMCGTMQSAQSRGEAAAIYPEWGAWLVDLERRARAKHGWGWGEPMPAPVDPRQIDMFQPMCAGCARDDMTAADRISLGAAA
ncbi:phosphoadenosine phosphosulfate reductase family protein [Sphingomonas sp. NY01]|uniref:phosphoadenosine phosphosulfate reductase domain-containing protein n=1 Tax=Sphingomonas sp. NY01 TaxID=2968057 RepID=UPI00315D074D